MDGYGEFFWNVAGIVALGGFAAGLIVRYHIGAVIAALIIAAFSGVFGDLFLRYHVDVFDSASIAVITTAFVSPLLFIAASVGRCITKLIQRKV